MQHTTLWTFVTFSAAPPHELLAALEASEIGSEIAVVRHLNFGHSCYSLILHWRTEFVMSVGKWDLWMQGGQGRPPLPASFRAVGDQVSGSPLSGDEAVKQSREVGHTPILKWMQSLLSPGKNHGYRVTMKKSTPEGSLNELRLRSRDDLTLAASGRITVFPAHPCYVKAETVFSSFTGACSAKGVLALTDVRCSAYPRFTWRPVLAHFPS